MIQTILELIEQKKIQQARTQLTQINKVDLAEWLQDLDLRDLSTVFRLLPKDFAADVFTYASLDLKTHIIHSLTDHEISQIMNDLFLDDVVDMIDEMPANVVKRLLANTDHETRKLINQFLQYPDASAGSIMTIEYVDLKKHMTVRQAFDHIRKTGVDKETIYTCYVTDAFRKLEGTVTVRTLLFSDPDQHIEEVMDPPQIFVRTLDDQEEIAQIFGHYDLISVPVVDSESRLVGIITIDDALDVIREENTEDFEKMAAMLPSEQPYLETSSLLLAKRRLPWLLLLMVSALFTGSILDHFEASLAAMPTLVAMIPMLMDTGGNSGSQTATLIIRGLALGQVQPADLVRIIWKETSIALILGAILALANGIRLVLFNHSVLMAVAVGLTLVVTVFMAKLIGVLLPLGAYKLKWDPAMMATPVITTIVDAGSLIAFFFFVRALLG